MSKSRLLKFFDQEFAYPPGTFLPEALLLPIALVAIPLILWQDAIFGSGAWRMAYFTYALLAVVFAVWWIVRAVRKVAHSKDHFYQRHEKPILSSEYRAEIDR